MKKRWLCMLCALLLLVGCTQNPGGTSGSSSAPEETSPSASEEESVTSAPLPEESSEAEEQSESSEESGESSLTEDDLVTGGNGEATFLENTIYQELAGEDVDDALMLLINRPEEAVIYSTPVSDEFNLTADDQVMMIPRYEHSTVRLWTLKTVLDPQTDEPVQERDEMVYECLDSTVRTVLFSSIPRIEDAPRYMVTVETPIGAAQYVFSYNSAAPAQEYLEIDALG